MAAQQASGPASGGIEKWLRGKSRSTSAIYWYPADKPSASQYEPPVNQYTVVIHGYVDVFRDDGHFYFWQFPASSCIAMVKRWCTVNGHAAGFPDNRSACLHALRELLCANKHALAMQLWSDEWHAFVLEVPPPRRSAPAVVQIPPAAVEWSHGQQWKNLHLLPHAHLRHMYNSRSVPSLVGPRKLSAAVGPPEGMLLYGLLRDNGFKSAVEVGCANGASAAFMCAAMEPVSSVSASAGAASGEQQGTRAAEVPTSGDVLADGTSLQLLAKQTEWINSRLQSQSPVVVSIDPFQTQQWRRGGQMNVAAGGYSTPHVLMECDGSLALSLLAHERCQFDLVFVDGMHLFDYTVVDLLLADQCCRVGGVIVLDDIRHAGVTASMAYVLTNYPHWELQEGVLASQTMATFIKRKPDERRWNFHKPITALTVGGVKRARV